MIDFMPLYAILDAIMVADSLAELKARSRLQLSLGSLSCNL